MRLTTRVALLRRRREGCRRGSYHRPMSETITLPRGQCTITMARCQCPDCGALMREPPTIERPRELEVFDLQKGPRGEPTEWFHRCVACGKVFHAPLLADGSVAVLTRPT